MTHRPLVGVIRAAADIDPDAAAMRLANGEVAIVCRRTRHADQPIVRALVTADGRRHEEPRKRLTSHSQYRVQKLARQCDLKGLPAADQLWDDSFTAEAAGAAAESDNPSQNHS